MHQGCSNSTGQDGLFSWCWETKEQQVVGICALEPSEHLLELVFCEVTVTEGFRRFSREFGVIQSEAMST